MHEPGMPTAPGHEMMVTSPCSAPSQGPAVVFSLSGWVASGEQGWTYIRAILTTRCLPYFSRYFIFIFSLATINEVFPPYELKVIIHENVAPCRWLSKCPPHHTHTHLPQRRLIWWALDKSQPGAQQYAELSTGKIQEMLKVELRMKIYYLSISLLFKVQYIYFTFKEWRKMVKLSLCVPTMFHFKSRYFSVDILQITLEAPLDTARTLLFYYLSETEKN